MFFRWSESGWRSEFSALDFPRNVHVCSKNYTQIVIIRKFAHYSAFCCNHVLITVFYRSTMTLGLGAVCHVKWSRLHPKNQLAVAYTNPVDTVNDLVVIGRENRVCRGKSKFCIVLQHPATASCPPFEVWCVRGSCKVDVEGPAEDFFDAGGTAAEGRAETEDAMPAAVLEAIANSAATDRHSISNSVQTDDDNLPTRLNYARKTNSQEPKRDMRSKRG